MKIDKGIILAGGSGSRLHPLTLSVSKQLMPVYDKPMIYYPLSTLMLAGIKNVLIITTEKDLPVFRNLLGSGSQWGIELSYEVQNEPRGLAEAFLIGENFLNGDPCVLILGDNIFHGHGLYEHLKKAIDGTYGCTVFAYRVADPSRYGVVEFDENGLVVSIEEKPSVPKSNYALTGLYIVDGSAVDRARIVKPSKRGELEITSILEHYLRENCLSVQVFGRGYTWLDTGTQDALLDASNFVRTVTDRQGLLVGSPDEVAFRMNWITHYELEQQIDKLSKSRYGECLRSLIKSDN